MDNSKSPLNRSLVAALSILALVAAGIIALWPRVGATAGGMMWSGSLTRVGLVLAALWMALPTSTRPAAWANVNPTSAAAAILIALALTRLPFRFLLPIAGVALVAGWLLRPHPPKRPPRSSDWDRS